jgi:transcription initiation factor IIE alpha subunit
MSEPKTYFEHVKLEKVQQIIEEKVRRETAKLIAAAERQKLKDALLEAAAVNHPAVGDQ